VEADTNNNAAQTALTINAANTNSGVGGGGGSGGRYAESPGVHRACTVLVRTE